MLKNMHARAVGGRRAFGSSAPRLAPIDAMQHVCHAKKKGGGGGGGAKGGNKKGGGALAELMKRKDQAASDAAAVAVEGDGLATHAQFAAPEVFFDLMCICTSYRKHYGEYLMETSAELLAEAMYKAPFVCMAHDKYQEGVTDPAFTYANRAALQLFEGTWDDIIGMPSRKSADEDAQEERNRLINLTDKGPQAIKSYSGWRRSLQGKRFKITDARFFNILDSDGSRCGQAVIFDSFELEDGTTVRVQGETLVADEPGEGVSEESLALAEEAVAQQAAVVRDLKEQQGRGNQDAEVQAAVAELKARKEKVEGIQAELERQAREADELDKLFDD